MKKRKYKNITELLAAFRSGEIDKKLWQLYMDNDDSGLTYIGPVPGGLDEDLADEFRDRRSDEARDMFSGGGYMDIVELCNAAGIPCEWC